MTTRLPRRTVLQSAGAAVVVVATGTVTACSSHSPGDSSSAKAPHELTVSTAGAAAVVDPKGTPAAVTVAATRLLLERASAVVVTSTHETDITAGAATARRLGVPLLVAGPELVGELDRLGTRTVIRYAGRSPQSPDPAAVPDEFGKREVVEGPAGDGVPEVAGLPLEPPTDAATVLLLEGTTLPAALAPLLHAVGATPLAVAAPDIRRSAQVRAALTTRPKAPVLAVGARFGAEEVFAQRVRTTTHASELPGGGLVPFPDRMMVALYGHPHTADLGMLGEQSARESVVRARALAKEYAALTDTVVVPAFELIATIASSVRGDGSYSTRTRRSELLPWIEAAENAGVYVVLDLQPGRSDFLTQAKAYEELLVRPWVGLALDPEWRLKPDQVHLKQIGSVGIEEVNEVGAWLAGLVRAHDLPPKVLTLHQFNLRMIRDRERLDTSLDEIQWLVHADGQGTQSEKQETWKALRRNLPDGVWLGWKNFEDEDRPMLTVEQTLELVHPRPSFVSYQ
ncbi:hypothetical protein [Knoellia sp. Soil729]|uniref:hypothetical protein n=1 Tax=Knoellia sp. Soil729 TaxID=1736394 RepID=UPI000701C359|nr:hypothetical protein [Knoellia sp. Soil729]KRE42849.1 hypothetical protein ASG74_10825 [Knoellia sp. Soil729]